MVTTWLLRVWHALVHRRWTVSEAALGLLLAGLLLFGLIEDVVELCCAGPVYGFSGPPLPDRWLGLSAPLSERPWLAYSATVLDSAISLILFACGVVLIAYRVWPLAVLCGLALADDLTLVGMALGSGVEDLYWSFYWPVALAALLRLAGTYPRTLRRSEITAEREKRRRPDAGRIRRLFRSAWGLTDRAALSPWFVWIGALVLGGLLSTLEADFDPESATPAALRRYRLGAVLTIGYSLFVVVKGASYFRFSLRLSEPSERARISLILYAGVTFAFTFLVTFILFPLLTDTDLPQWGLVSSFLYSVGLLATSMLIFWAVYARGALNPTWILQRASVVTLAYLVAMVAYLLAEEAVVGRAQEILEIPRGVGQAALAGALVLGALPLQRAIAALAEPWTLRVAQFLENDAVVMFTDFVGFSGIQRRDLAASVRLVKQLHRASRRLGIANGGRVVRQTGDGILAQYLGSEEAIRSASALHTGGWALAVEGVEEEVAIRTAIHAGTVVPAGPDRLLGEAVTGTFRLHNAVRGSEIRLSSAAADGLSDTTRDMLRPVEEAVDLGDGVEVPTYTFETGGSEGAS